MNFALTQEQQMIQDMARNFAENEIKPHVEEDEKNQYWRREIFEKMAGLGFFGLLYFCQADLLPFLALTAGSVGAYFATIALSWVVLVPAALVGLAGMGGFAYLSVFG